METPVKKLRLALGWSQVQFAQAIGRSYASVQGYEAGKRVPREIVEKMRSIAVQNGLADVALELSSDDWQVRRVFHPGEVLISRAARIVQQGKQQNRSASTSPVAKPARHSTDEWRGYWHEILDEILDSGVPDVVSALERNLELFAGFARTGKPAASPRKRRV